MLRYTVRRLGQLLLVVAALSVLLFAWLRSLPGGPVSALLGERGTAQDRAELTAAFGLDQPIWVQYGRFLQRALSGDFGVSTGVQPGDPAGAIFLQRFPATVELATLGVLIALAIGIPFGYLAARRRDTWFDNVGVVSSLIGVAVPVFFLAFLLKYVFAVELGWLPTSGRQSVGIDATRVTGFFVLDGLLTREWDAAWDALKHLILPALALSSIPFAVIFRITRASVLDVQDEDYVRTAYSKGLTERVIRGRHVLRNALLPVVTVIGLQAGLLFSGAILTETVFAFDGMGRFVFQAIQTRDYAVLQGSILIIAALYVLVNLAVDISYGLIDPRVRVQ